MSRSGALDWLDERRLIQDQEYQKQVLDRKSPASKVLLNDQEQMYEKEIWLMEEQGAEEARDTVPALQEQLTTLRAELVKRTAVTADLQNTMQVQVTRLQNERDSLRKRVTAMEDFYKIEGTTFGDLEKMNDLKRELAGAQVVNAEKERIVRQMKEKYGGLREYIDHLESKLVGYEEDAKKLHEEIAKMEARRKADSLAIHTLERRLLERDNQHLKTLGESEEALDAHSELLARLEVVMRESKDKLLQQGQKLGTRKALLQGNDRPRTASSESDGVNRK